MGGWEDKTVTQEGKILQLFEGWKDKPLSCIKEDGFEWKLNFSF